MSRNACSSMLLCLLLALGVSACGGDEPDGHEGHDMESGDPIQEGSQDGASGEMSSDDPYANLLTLPEQDYPPAVEESLTTALAAYAEVSDLLTRDTIDGLAPRASRLARALSLAADAAETSSPQAANLMDEAARTATSLERAGDLETARGAFAELNRALLPIVGADPELAERWTVFECPMTDGFGRWMQAGDESQDLENPFMGQEMLICGGALPWEDAAPARPPATMEEAEDHARFAHGGADPDEIAYYTCSMHPSVRSNDPGQCPICNMALTPVTREEIESGVVIVDAARRQMIGVKTGRVERRSVPVTVRAVGEVVMDETRLADVSVKYKGWIGRLNVDETGQAVRRGQTLFTLYSPELYAAQEEYLAALESQGAARGTGAPDRADYLVNAARKRLRLWDLSEAQIDRLAETGEPIEYIPILSPAAGYVVEKNVVAGAVRRARGAALPDRRPRPGVGRGGGLRVGAGAGGGGADGHRQLPLPAGPDPSGTGHLRHALPGRRHPHRQGADRARQPGPPDQAGHVRQRPPGAHRRVGAGGAGRRGALRRGAGVRLPRPGGGAPAAEAGGHGP